MSVLTSLIGGIVVITLVIRGGFAFYDDFKSKKTQKPAQEEKQ